MSKNNSISIYEEYGVIIKEENPDKGTVVVREHNFRSSERSCGDYEAYNPKYAMYEKDNENDKLKNKTIFDKALKKKWWLIVTLSVLVLGALIIGLVFGLKNPPPKDLSTTTTTSILTKTTTTAATATTTTTTFTTRTTSTTTTLTTASKIKLSTTKNTVGKNGICRGEFIDK